MLATRYLTSSRYFFAGRPPRKFQGTSFEDAYKDRKKYMFPFMTHYYKQPFYTIQGSKEFLYDHTGTQYIDLMAGISAINLGHSHPRLTKIYHDQVDKLLHISPIYMHEFQGQYSKMLCQELGPEFDSVYLCNSGSQANDFVHMLMRQYTRRQKVYCLRNAYHGGQGFAGRMTHIHTWNSPLPGKLQTEALPMPFFYQCVQKSVEQLIKDSEQHIQSTCHGGGIAGFIAQPVMGAGGIIPLPQGYLKKMYQLTRKYNGLCVADEVQTGFGRIGKDFWGFKQAGVKPDIVVVAKAIANGFPMAAVVTRREIMESITQVFFNTYGGGILQCRLAMQTLKTLKQQKLHERAEKVGAYFLSEMKKIGEQSKWIGNVRGKGLLIAFDLVKNKQTKQMAIPQTLQVLQRMKSKHILMGKGGMGNTVRILPPLCISDQSAQKVIKGLKQTFKEMQ